MNAPVPVAITASVASSSAGFYGGGDGGGLFGKELGCVFVFQTFALIHLASVVPTRAVLICQFLSGCYVDAGNPVLCRAEISPF